MDKEVERGCHISPEEHPVDNFGQTDGFSKDLEHSKKDHGHRNGIWSAAADHNRPPWVWRRRLSSGPIDLRALIGEVILGNHHFHSCSDCPEAAGQVFIWTRVADNLRHDFRSPDKGLIADHCINIKNLFNPIDSICRFWYRSILFVLLDAVGYRYSQALDLRPWAFNITSNLKAGSWIKIIADLYKKGWPVPLCRMPEAWLQQIF